MPMGFSSIKTHLFSTWSSNNTARRRQTQAEIQKFLQNATFSEVLQETTPDFDLKGLVDAATESFKIFKPFCDQMISSENSIINEVSEDIRKQYHEYRLAINASIKSAQLGYSFADDGVALCGHIKNNEPLVEIISFIKTMGNLAKEAHDLACETGTKFRIIRQEIFEISKSILARVTVHENGGSGSVGADSLNARWDPDKSPLYSTKSFSEVLEVLSRDVEGLGTQVGSFADWWIETETKLVGLVKKVEVLDPTDLQRLQVESIRLRWVDVRERYSRYKQKIALLEDTATPVHPALDISRAATIQGVQAISTADVLEDTKYVEVRVTKAKPVRNHRLLPMLNSIKERVF